MTKSKVYAEHKYARISPKKVAPVLKLVRGLNVREAMRTLEFDGTKGSKLSYKVLKSALANATNNAGLKEQDLIVKEAYVTPGPDFKRRRINGRHFNIIRKRTSHIVFGLDERAVKGK